MSTYKLPISEDMEILERLKTNPPDAFKDTQIILTTPPVPRPDSLKTPESEAERAARIAEGINRKSPWPARCTTLRKVLQASQTDLAAMIGASRSLISGIEHSKRHPGLATQHKLSELALRAGLLSNVFDWLPNTVQTRTGASREESPLYEQRLYDAELDAAVWAARVKRLRFFCQMNLRQFAHTLGVQRAAVIGWEKGINVPTTVTKQRLEAIREMQGFDWNLGHLANIFLVTTKYIYNYCYDLRVPIEHATGRNWSYIELWAAGNYLDNDMTLLTEESMARLLHTFTSLLFKRREAPVRHDLLAAPKPGDPEYVEQTHDPRDPPQPANLTDEERVRISRELDAALASDDTTNIQKAMEIATSSERQLHADKIARDKNLHMLEDVEHDYMTSDPKLVDEQSVEVEPGLELELESETTGKIPHHDQVRGSDSPANEPDQKGFDDFLDSLHGEGDEEGDA